MSKCFVVSDIPGNRYMVVSYRDVICYCYDFDNACKIADSLNKLLL